MRLTKKFYKYALHIFNLSLAILGMLMIWYGFWLLDSIENTKIDHGERLAGILIAILGFIIVVVSVCGFFANFLESMRMLAAYAVTMIVLLAIQLVLISISYLAAKDAAPKELKKGFEELWDPNNEHTNGTLSMYEEWLHCCGRNSAEDYLLLDKIPPASCCKDRDCSKILNLYIDGCEVKFKDYIVAKTSDFNTISWLLISIEFVSSVLACVMVESIRSQRDRMRLYS